MRGLPLVVIALGAATTCRAAERPLIIPAEGASVERIEASAPRRGLAVARPPREPDIAAESLLAEVRPLYRDMAFARAAARLAAAEQSLVEARLPTARLAAALAEIELWLGACLLVDDKTADAQDHFALARALAPAARPDRIFPPEVQAAFARATPGPRVEPHLALSPPGARLWIDGKPAPATTTAGLHWIVVERADRRAVARVMRVTQAAPEIAVHLGDAAPPADALGQLAARAAEGPVGGDEALGAATALGRTVWIVGPSGADRFDAADVARPTRHLDFAAGAASGAGAADPVDALCAAEPGCLALPVARKPIYKRAALWVPVAIGVVLAVGAGVLGATLANSSSDYVVRVR